MKLKKDKVFELTRQIIYTSNKYKDGVDTNTIASALNMQRTNVSTLLNALVEDGKLVKSTSRPVMYRLADDYSYEYENDCFEKIIGYKESYRKAIQMTKAAILYPNHSLNMLLLSKPGSGVNLYAEQIHQFSVDSLIFKKNSPFIKIVVRHYQKNINEMDHILFGDDENEGAFEKARGGILFIKGFDLLNNSQQSKIMEFLETHEIVIDHQRTNYDDVYLLLSADIDNCSEEIKKSAMVIELPSYKDKAIDERFELICYLIQKQSNQANIAIDITIEAMKALLLAEYPFNTKQLKNEIISSCANGYARVVNKEVELIDITIGDLSETIKKGLLFERQYKLELDKLFENKTNLIFNPIVTKDRSMDDSIYAQIRKEYDSKKNKEDDTERLSKIISNYVQKNVPEYASSEKYNTKYIEKIVRPEVVKTVLDFLGKNELLDNSSLSARIFYGLCLHIESLCAHRNHSNVSSEQVESVEKNYPEEVRLAGELSKLISANLNVQLGNDQIAVLALFFINKDTMTNKSPVLLYVMHGRNTAKSLSEVTNELTKCNNAYGYDVTLDSVSSQVIEELKQLILTIDNGGGVIAIYDMGSIKTMLESIESEIDVPIRYINVPITMIGIDIARRCNTGDTIDNVCHTTATDFELFKGQKKELDSLIVTLCHTGEGGAIQLKKYIDKNSHLGMRTIALAVSDHKALVDEIKRLAKIYDIHTFVGTYNPKIFGIPFVSIDKIFNTPAEYLDQILMFKPIGTSAMDYQKIYEQFENDFLYASIDKIKNIIPEVTDELSYTYKLNTDQITGLFVHLSCLVERVLKGDKDFGDNKNDIIEKFPQDYKYVVKSLRKIEKKFNIIIPDQEIATVITIVKKL